MSYKSYLNETEFTIDDLITNSLTITGVNTNSILATDKNGTVRSIKVSNSNGTDFKYDNGILAASMTQNLTMTGDPIFESVDVKTLTVGAFDVKIDPTFGLTVFDYSGEQASIPFSIIPNSDPLGPAIVAGAKLITTETIEFLHGSTKQVLASMIPSVNQTWTLPNLNTGSLTFAALESEQTFTGSKSFSEITNFAKRIFADGLSTSANILPVTSGLYSIGSSTHGFNELRLHRGTGKIGLGWSIRVPSQAELHLNASGDNRSEITFGTGDIDRKNCKWVFNSFRANEGNHFSLMRGPAIANGNFEYVLHVDGSTSQFRYNIVTDSTSTTTGSATFAGGVGIAKSLHAKNIVTDTLTIAGSTVDPSGIVTLGGNQIITGSKVFSGPLYVGPGPTIDPFAVNLQSVSWSDLVSINQDLSKNSHVTFASTVADEINVTGALTVAGISVNPSEYVTLNSVQQISGSKAFTGQLKMSGTLEVGPNGMYDLTTMPWEYLTSMNQSLTTTSSPSFAGLTLDGINVNLSDYVTLTTEQIISGNKTFNGSLYNGVNNLTTMPWQHLAGINQGLTTTSDVTFNTIAATGITVGGVAVTPSNYVTLNTEQYISGQKTFGQTLIPAGTSVDLGTTTKIFGVININSVWTNNVRVGSSVLPRTISNGPAPAVNIGSTTDPFNVVYANDVKVSGQSVTPLNYVTLDSEQDITGYKKFNGNIRVGGEFDAKITLPSYGGVNYIHSHIPNDNNHTMDFYLRNQKIMTLNTGFVGSGNLPNVQIHDRLRVFGTGDATSTTTGAATFAGGLGIAKTLHANAIVTDNITLRGYPLHILGEVRGNWSHVGGNVSDTMEFIVLTTKVIEFVNLTFHARAFTITSGSVAALTISGVIPSLLRPYSKMSVPIFIKSNNVEYRPGIAILEINGNMTVRHLDGSNFTGQSGYDQFSFSFTRA